MNIQDWIPLGWTGSISLQSKGLSIDSLLDLIDTVPEELWTEVHDIVQEAVIKTIPKKKKSKMAVWRDFTNSCEKKRSQKAKEKRKDIPVWMQSSKEYQGEIKPS